MKQTFTAVVKQEGDSWIGWIEEVPEVNCEERSALPRHTQINDHLARKICRDLGVVDPERY